MRPLDALTGLPQRDLFEESVQCAILSARAARRGFALLHIDLDRFKDVNELVGRDGADGVLRAARLTASIGISLYPAHAVNARALMQDAQRAMLRAKLQGRDRFYPELPTCFAGTDLPPRTARG